MNRVVGLVAWHFLHTARQAGDFIAFYCGGHTVVAHGEPYLIEPIRSCEHALSQGFASKATLPAPGTRLVRRAGSHRKSESAVLSYIVRAFSNRSPHSTRMGNKQR